MRVVFYWWGFRVYVDAALVQQLIGVVAQGRAAIQAWLDQQGWGWLGPLVTALANWGADAIRQVANYCGGRPLAFDIRWNNWWPVMVCA